MPTITFQNEDAHVGFHSMAEGMWEIARDDMPLVGGDPAKEPARFDRLIEATGWDGDADYPRVYRVSAEALATAEEVLANLVDNEEDEGGDPRAVILLAP